MYGWRARIGSLGATPTDIFPYEFYRIVPEGISIMPASLSIPQVKEKDLKEGRDAIEAVAKALAREGADAIILGGAPMLYAQGAGSDRILSDQITKAAGIPTISNQTAMMDALKALEANKILIASPFVKQTNEKLKTFLEGSGFKVVGMGGYGLSKNADINRITRQQAYHFVRDTFVKHQQKGIQGILMPCANWPTSLLVEKWETDLDVPVVTSNLAKIWAVLRVLGIKDKITGFGRLLEKRR
jgi:maleate cis-trans isomerase